MAIASAVISPKMVVPNPSSFDVSGDRARAGAVVTAAIVRSDASDTIVLEIPHQFVGPRPTKRRQKPGSARWWATPWTLAAYIARSAARSRDSSDVPWAGNRAAPTLAFSS